MSRTYDAVAKAFAALDLSDLNERFTGNEKRREEAEQAVQRAEARCTEITRTIKDWRGVDSAAIADALVHGDADQATQAAGDISELEAEKSKLREGIGELRRRINETYDCQNAAKSEALSRVGPLADPLVDELHAQAEEAAEVLLRVWISATAISRTSASGKAERLAEGLKGPVEALTRHPGLLGKKGSNAFPVPGDIVALFQPLLGKGPAFRNGAMLQVTSPSAETAMLAQNISRLK